MFHYGERLRIKWEKEVIFTLKNFTFWLEKDVRKVKKKLHSTKLSLTSDKWGTI